MVALPIFVALVIIVSDGINNNSGIISAIATMLLITLSVTESQSVYFAIDRVLDTFIGTFIALAINFILRPPTNEKEKEIAEDLVELKKKKKNYTLCLQKYKAK